MKTLSILAAGVLASLTYLGTAQAGELDWPLQETSATTLTRAQVVADLQSARSQGLVATTEVGELPLAAHAASQVTRAQVRQELSAAQAAGLEASGELDYPPVAG
ncbi:hypothetical protein CEK29_20970 [Bordetella genomosp. 5]|uniref:DUF4148 domain-containing protein n=1 Tax=Bordetella genomosp. 5 TaxID=1395608 RepID=UPI000B9DD9E7|nr:DUF4148 domain-containing protein [Bordetella genomosp. 5]OZI36859.1 hypothetical protein CEK29_20970 [Bordetella genomosp. 5]